MVALTSALYLPKLGFYSDDWKILSIFAFSDDQSLVGLSSSLISADPLVAESADMGVLARPLQVIYFAALYHAFGLNPLGYHVVNAMVFLAGLCAFYLALQALGASRLFALAVVFVYSALPHYSSDRFWYAAFQANLSMALYFFGLYACVRQLTAVRTMRLVWMAAAALGLIGSALAYEVFLPLFVLGLAVIAVKQFRLSRSAKAIPLRSGDLASLYLGLPLLIGLVVVFKKSVTNRAGSIGYWLLGDALSASVELTFNAYGANLPHILQVIYREYFDWPALIVSAITAAFVWLYLRKVAAVGFERTASVPMLLVIASCSVVAAGMSYAYFYDFFRVNTGINNRVAIAASVCVALFLVSSVSLVTASARRPPSGATFCGAVAVICGCGTLLINTIATFWLVASREQTQIVEGIRAAWPHPPGGSSILLHGLCSWVGPGIVFETDWDVTGAVRLMYRDPTLRGDVLRPWMVAERDGLRSGDAVHSYASLHVYDGRAKRVRRIDDEGSASKLLATLVAEDATGCAGNYKAFGAGLPIW